MGKHLGLRLALMSSSLLIALTAGTTTAEPDTFDVVSGRSAFRTYCTSCHGPEAKGDGPLAEYLDPKPADLTQIAQREGGEFPTEMVHQVIDGRQKVRGHGSKDMPVWGDAFLKTDATPDEASAQERISQLVAFLASIQGE